MNIDVYALCWNEERFLPYFLRHYSSIASRVTIFDNESTDRSVEIIQSFPNTRVLSYASGGELREDIRRDYKNECWKESKSRADWVIVVDIDEIVYHPRLHEYLATCSLRGITLPWTVGYEMATDRFPMTRGQIYDEVIDGVHDPWYSKPVVFDPNALDDINYEPGAHRCAPTGRVAEERSADLKLLHYRFLGLEYVQARFAAMRDRQSEVNVQQGWSYHLHKQPREIKRWFKSTKKQARPVI
jgi:glycosyltransferase involved in cell wall biosynthesis